MLLFWLFGLGCAHEPDAPWLAAARIYGSPEPLPPLHHERGHFFHPFELEHNAKVVLTHPRPEWWDWFPIFKQLSDKPILDSARIEADAERLAQWFRDQGWLDAEVRWETRVHARSGGVIVDYHVQYGDRYRVQDTQLTGWPNSNPPAIDMLSSKNWSRAAAEAIQAMLLHELHRLGYAAAEISLDIEKNTEASTGSVLYQITAHQPKTVGHIEIEGVTGRAEKRIRQMAEKELGEDSDFDPDKIDIIAHRLASTPAYSAVELSIHAEPQGEHVDLRLELQAQDKWLFKPYATFASEATLYELGGGFRWARSHLGKRNASITGSHQVGYRTFPFFGWPPAVRLNDYGITSKHEGEIWTAIVPMRGLSLSARAYNELGAEIGYQLLSTKVEGGLRWSPRTPFVIFGGVGYGQDIFFAYRPQQATFSEWFGPQKLATNTELIFGSLHITGDWVDDTESPRQGFQWRLDGQPYGQIENIPYTRIHNDMRVLASTGPWTFIQRLGAGQVWWHDESLDSLSLRFFLGGGQSVRSWGRRRLEAPGYTGSLMEPRLGGDAMLQSSSELRYTLFPDWSVLTFIDAGRVWPSLADIRLDQLLPSAGFGVRAPTPLGMATATVAYQLIGDNELAYPPPRINGHFVLSESF